MPSPSTVFNPHSRGRNRQFAGKESDQFVICRAIDRRCGDSDLQRVSVTANTFCSGGFRLDMDREEDSVLAVLHDGKTHEMWESTRMFKKPVQQGRNEREGEAYSLSYVEPLSDVRTQLTGFFNILKKSL
jgi:hypothetical protein